jgi:hypothetical protein
MFRSRLTTAARSIKKPKDIWREVIVADMQVLLPAGLLDPGTHFSAAISIPARTQ